MNMDLRCLSAGLILLVILGVSWAVPLDLYEPEGGWQGNDQHQEEKRYPLDDWTYPALAPRETRGRKNWRSSPYKMKLVDDSVKTFSSRISLCNRNQVCKQVEKSRFNCRCPVYTFCVADGRQYDATCQFSKVGLVYNQPRL